MSAPLDIAIGPQHPPFIIAEMSGNHNGSLERALAIVDAMADAGVSAVKLQTYTADTMTIDIRDREFYIDDPKSLWNGRSLYELYQEAHTPWAWHEPIFRRCRERGIAGFSTPFDITAVDFLESLGVALYKVASFEIIDLPLIQRIARTGKPMIMSTGMASLSEITEAVAAARSGGCTNLTLLKCTSAYPAPPGLTNLRAIPAMGQLFGCNVGLSDHTLGIGVSVAAIAFGTSVIEKHVTLRRSDGGVDSAFSLEPEEVAALVSESRRAWEALGEVRFGASEEERTSTSHRRSLYFVRDIAAGTPIQPGDVRAIRPGLGLPPKHLNTVIGMRVRSDVSRGTPVAWELLG